MHERDVLAVVDGDAVAVGSELTVPGGQPGLGDPHHEALVTTPVAHEVLDGDHREPVLVGEGAQLGRPLHRSVVVDHLHEHAGRREPGQLGEVDRGLGVAAPDQHAAVAVAQREHVPGRVRSHGSVAESASVRAVCARSAALMPVLTPSRASTEIV